MKRKIKYNLIRTSDKTLNDYVQSLNNDDLQTIYTSSFVYGIKVPDIIRKIQDELQRRNLSVQPILF